MKEQEHNNQPEQTQTVAEPAVVYGTIISPRLEEKIAVAREEYQNGTTECCYTKEELLTFLNSL